MIINRSLLCWSKKILYGLLIIWVCGLSPLVYFGNYSSHQGVHSYQLSLFQKPGQFRELQLALAQISAEQRSEQMLIQRLFSKDHFFGTKNHFFGTKNHFFGTSHTVSFVAPSALYQGYIWATLNNISLRNADAFFGRVYSTVLLGSSVWLPLPEKPPSSFLYLRLP